MTAEFLSPNKLGPVKAHGSIESFAELLVKQNAINEAGALGIADLVALSKIDRRSIYNKLNRPGFVKVLGRGHNRYYYLYNEGFGKLAKAQGADYYPYNLAPLVGNIIPVSVEASGHPRAKSIEVTGNMVTDVEDAIPLIVRAAGISDTHVISGTLKDAGPKIIEALANPITSRLTIDNTLVLLSGIRRWLEEYDTYDQEKQDYIKAALDE